MPHEVAANPVEEHAHDMQCMEVWGGNHAFDGGVAMTGIDAWVLARPYQENDEGGDVHYLSSCATGRITRMLLADVSGHGSVVAETSTRLRSMMRRHINHVRQTRIMRALNEEFTALDDDGRFATAIVASFFAPTGRLLLSNAGHPPPFLYRESTGTWTLASRAERAEGLTNLPLGVIEDVGFDQLEYDLEPGDALLAYTDGLTESVDEHGDMLGVAGVLELLNSIESPTRDTLLNAIIDRVRSMNPSNAFDDDFTLMLAVVNTGASYAPLHRRLLGALKFLGGVALSPFSGFRQIPLPEFDVPKVLGAFRVRTPR